MMRDSGPNVNVRLRRAIRERGLGPAWKAAWRHAVFFWSCLVDRHFDPAFGTETRRVVETSGLQDVASANRSRGIRYEPTHALPFRRVMRAAAIPTDGGFVDLGCGKGRVLILAALCGFRSVTGVDYSPSLCALAEKNLAAFRSRSRRPFRSRVLTMDAADYAFTREDTVVYLFNPFDAAVLSAVLLRLRRSLLPYPRRVWIVYHNPVWRSTIETTGDFEPVADYSSGGRVFAIYRSRA